MLFLESVNELLSIPIDTIKEWEISLFDEITKGYDGLVLFGAGGFGRRTMDGLEKLNIKPKAFIDNNQSLWGEYINSIPIISIEKACKLYGQTSIFIITIWGAQGKSKLDSLIQLLKNKGAKCVITFLPLYWKYPDVFLPYYCLELPHKVLESTSTIRKILPFISDTYSEQEFFGQLNFRLFGETKGLIPSWDSSIQPFLPEVIQPNIDEILIDAGAFDGDTIRNFFTWRQGISFKKIYAFEPDPKNMFALTQFTDLLSPEVERKIEKFPYALSNKNGAANFFSNAGLSSSLGGGSIQVQCVPLDEMITDCSPIIIKMDIEGAEALAIQGAEKIIRKCKPRLIVSIYHAQDHLWSIPEMILSINPDYHFKFRTFSQNGWETICYAE